MSLFEVRELGLMKLREAVQFNMPNSISTSAFHAGELMTLMYVRFHVRHFSALDDRYSEIYMYE